MTPMAFAYHAYAKLVTKSGLGDALHDVERSQLLRNRVLPPALSTREKVCHASKSIKSFASGRLLPCCLRENWRQVTCSYQSHLGRICPCHVRILGPKRKITILSHPCLEDYVILPTRPPVKTSLVRKGKRQLWQVGRQGTGFLSLAGVAEPGLSQHARALARLMWTIDAADNGQKASPDDHHAEAPKLLGTPLLMF